MSDAQLNSYILGVPGDEAGGAESTSKVRTKSAMPKTGATPSPQKNTTALPHLFKILATSYLLYVLVI